MLFKQRNSPSLVQGKVGLRSFLTGDGIVVRLENVDGCDASGDSVNKNKINGHKTSMVRVD